MVRVMTKMDARHVREQWKRFGLGREAREVLCQQAFVALAHRIDESVEPPRGASACGDDRPSSHSM
jgi:hypothetical protein